MIPEKLRRLTTAVPLSVAQRITKATHRGAACLLLLTLAPAALADGPRESKHPRPAPAPLRFAVISDPHLYDTRLGTSGAAFEDYLNQDPKLLRESEAILEAALDRVIEQKARFVIIPGDLTKDGELTSHVRMAQHLAKLERHGIQVFVVPGNHDLNNPDAVAYCGDTTRPVPNVGPRLFRAIYNRFGYGEAIDRDPNSLSYVAEPARDLWLLAIDSTDAQENEELGTPAVGGRLSPLTLDWVLDKLAEAQQRGKRVLAFMHHGVNLNFIPQDQIFTDFLVDDWASVGTVLANAGLKVIFTGHYHSTDAAYPLNATGTPVPTLCDVETASLASYPCAFRNVTLDAENRLHIQTERITAIDADTGGVPFQTYAENFSRARLPALATQQLMALFNLPEAQAAQIAPFVADVLIAQYAGDEMPSPQTQGVLNAFLGSPEPLHTLGLILSGMWTDLPPGDNNLVVPLTGN